MFLRRNNGPAQNGPRGHGVRVGRLFSFAVLGVVFSLLASTANADELKRLYAQILRDPTNSELNFRYAELAEQRGEIRKALSAYERVAQNDPNHPRVMMALQRIRRMLQPNQTQFYAQLGAAYETNPARTSGNERDEGSIVARLAMRDERGVGNGMRWRTIGQLSGDIYFDTGDLSYGYAGFYTGPLIDITPTIAMHAALGGSGAYYDSRLFYKEALASIVFESFLEGAFHTVRLRAAHRDYGDNFASTNGMYADIVGRFSFADWLGPNTTVSFSPWYRWSDIGGTSFSVIVPQDLIQPGRYTEFGARIDAYKRVFDWLSFGVGISASQRDYEPAFDVLNLVTVDRRDVTITPHATVIFHKVLGEQNDLRLQYRYEHNDSTYPQRDYENHVTTMLMLSRF
jgi:tetratricopeptide (TPR) repeat protein